MLDCPHLQTLQIWSLLPRRRATHLSGSLLALAAAVTAAAHYTHGGRAAYHYVEDAGPQLHELARQGSEWAQRPVRLLPFAISA